MVDALDAGALLCTLLFAFAKEEAKKFGTGPSFFGAASIDLDSSLLLLLGGAAKKPGDVADAALDVGDARAPALETVESGEGFAG